MALHIGEKIRERAAQLRIGPTEFGRMIHTSKQNVHGIYKRQSIDTDLLKKICEALQYDFFSFYADEEKGVKEEQAPYRKPVKNFHDVNEELNALWKALRQLSEKPERTGKSKSSAGRKK